MIEEANTNRTGGNDNLDMIEYIVSLIENKVGDLLLAEFFHECRSQNDIMSKPKALQLPLAMTNLILGLSASPPDIVT